MAYRSARYLDGATATDFQISKHTRRHHLALILELFGYRMIDQRTRLTLKERALAAARISSRPVHVLRDLTDYLPSPTPTVVDSVSGPSKSRTCGMSALA